MQQATMTLEQFAKYAGISKDLAYALVKAGKVPYIRLGIGRGRILFRKEAVDAWLASQEQQVR
ncbi:hypothetical protein PAE9249_04552 [Paenibacillus sp. CECT 9249]|jgi:excisionase family DNA binding protein|uniref:helix-turn-helix transcriptional regulator n=1 Tax=Paenibacillus sp. CECT 9249 TaxID=2845385 RepID=UPI001E45B82A|nr:helix-turn-helix domain-containing protein [Paenibacillus sp. CECT 9249]CAH0122015.1 hypothetical protein PAE9249_04552 [Paenibacillus sp. CECT 9249]